MNLKIDGIKNYFNKYVKQKTYSFIDSESENINVENICENYNFVINNKINNIINFENKYKSNQYLGYIPTDNSIQKNKTAIYG